MGSLTLTQIQTFEAKEEFVPFGVIDIMRGRQTPTSIWKLMAMEND
jgi:hypothetical protein